MALSFSYEFRPGKTYRHVLVLAGSSFTHVSIYICICLHGPSLVNRFVCMCNTYLSDASIFDATKSFGLKQFGINLDQYSADVTANNNITTSAQVAPTASFETVQPIKQAPPSKPSALGPIMGGFSSGIKTATSLGWKPFG